MTLPARIEKQFQVQASQAAYGFSQDEKMARETFVFQALHDAYSLRDGEVRELVEALKWYAWWDWSDKYLQAVRSRAREALQKDKEDTSQPDKK